MLKQSFLLLSFGCSLVWSLESEESMARTNTYSQILNNPTNNNNPYLHQYKDIYFLDQQWIPEQIEDTAYWVGPGDVFQVNIAEESYILAVTTENEIVFPSFKVIQLKSTRLDSTKNQIREELKLKYTGNPPLVTLKAPRRIDVQVTGAIAKPGRQILAPFSRLSDGIKAAGNFNRRAQSRFISIIHGKDTTVIDHQKYYKNGDVKFDPLLRHGDRIFVPNLSGKETTVVLQFNDQSQQVALYSDDKLDDVILRAFQYNHSNIYNQVEEYCGKTSKTISLDDISTVTPQVGCKYALSNYTEQVFLAGAVRQLGAMPWKTKKTIHQYISEAGLNEDSKMPDEVRVTHASGETEYLDPFTTFAQPSDRIEVDQVFIKPFRDYFSILIQTATLVVSCFTLYYYSVQTNHLTR